MIVIRRASSRLPLDNPANGAHLPGVGYADPATSTHVLMKLLTVLAGTDTSTIGRANAP